MFVFRYRFVGYRLLFCCLLAAASLPSLAAGPVRVFVLAGQSNMEGQGAISALDENGRERPGTLVALASDPATRPLVRPWVDTRKPKTAERIEIQADNATFGDPAPNVRKQLQVECLVNGKRQTLTAREQETLTLPGDSNAVTIERAWYGDLPDGPKKEVTEIVRRLADAAKHRIHWKSSDHVWVWFNGRKGRLTPGFGAGPDLFGPELGFGQALGASISDPILIIKTAWGGKSLFADFRPPGSGGEVGPNYTLLVQTVEKVMADLSTEFPELSGRKCELAGLVWWQGWNDAYPKGAVPEYERNLVNLIQNLRHDLN
ncbi:MAG TPA: sialate O-acetylesterase, partial [Chthonomonadaceae bacterium]|nr:sialate O-acetylesterase [Chthonomonadaceae bacterium]